jgi:hypothetical protein
MKEIIARDLKEYEQKENVDLATWISAAVASFVRASSQSLRVFNGEQAMKLFFRRYALEPTQTQIFIFLDPEHRSVNLVVVHMKIYHC